MGNDYEIVDSEGHVPRHKGKMSPVERIVADLPEDYLILSKAANILGMNKETLRRLVNTDRVKAPSKILKIGRMEVKLFTEEDLKELGAHFGLTHRVNDYLKDTQ